MTEAETTTERQATTEAEATIDAEQHYIPMQAKMTEGEAKCRLAV